MRQHPIFSAEIIRPLFDDALVDGVRHHHERWSGGGYPDGLAGEDIPLAARIFSLVDVYDALTSDRPYRAAWTQAEAVDYIQLQSGKYFDPAIVPAFLEMVNSRQDLPL
jgi:HD-GYP domain-containing protein (c-di-GMP phosphodiesterase class II)